MRIKALCITGNDADRPTTATFVGLHRAGIDLTVALPMSAGARQTLIAEGIRVLDYGITRRLDTRGIRRLRREIVEYGYDIVHVFSGRALQNAILALWGLDVRLVAYRGTVGNVNFLDPSSWVRFLSPRIDRIVCVSEAVRQYFLQLGPSFWHMPVERPVTIYKGHDLAWYTAEPKDLKLIGIPDGSFVVSCVANYRPHKGIEWLVRAMDQIADLTDVHLLLIGHMEHESLDREIQASAASERIHRVGFRDDVQSLVAASDVFVMPSTRREGFPRALVEAMAYGIPAVASDCGGNPELVADQVSGIVVPVEDATAIGAAIRSLHADSQLRARYGTAGRERVRTIFNVNNTIRQTFELYQELVPGTVGSEAAARD